MITCVSSSPSLLRSGRSTMADKQQFNVQFRGKRYDLKRFLHDHPGGINTLEKYRDRSVSEAMEIFGHSESAYHMLRDFKVGKDPNLTGGVSANGRILTSGEEIKNDEEVTFLEELEDRLDWSQPILHQLDKIAPDYDRWVHSAVFRQCRLFSSAVLESMTFTPWYVVPGVWLPVILYLTGTQLGKRVFCADSCTEAPLTPLQFLYHMIFGGCIWTVLEYSLHRWVFHLDPGSSVLMIKIHFLIHGMHHKVPFDELRQVFPPVPAMLLVSIIYMPVRVLLSYPLVKMAGGLIGYLTYDMIHYYVHHGSPADGTYLYAMKRYHSNHHFVNHNKAFGITSKLWDLVFRTFVQVRKLGFSLRW